MACWKAFTKNTKKAQKLKLFFLENILAGKAKLVFLHKIYYFYGMQLEFFPTYPRLTPVVTSPLPVYDLTEDWKAFDHPEAETKAEEAEAQAQALVRELEELRNLLKAQKQYTE